MISLRRINEQNFVLNIMFRLKPALALLFSGMAQTNISGPENCLNCGEEVNGNYCSNCGQKNQPTRLPLKLFVEDAAETLFNVDNRVFRTIKDLFSSPGKVTLKYIKGQRAEYLPPLRIYISISVLYFFILTLIETNKVFFIDFGSDSESTNALASKIQYLLFFLVPVMALIVQLFYRKQKKYYVEFLIFSMHIHSIWFVLLSFDLLAIYLGSLVEHSYRSILYLLVVGLSIVSNFLPFAYLTMSLKKVFGEGWIRSVVKTLGIIFLYFMVLALVAIMILFLGRYDT